MTDDHDDHDYEVGYGKPPKHSRFKKGRSGNPEGRPKGSRNLSTELMEELRESIRIREGGNTRTISKAKGVIKALVAKALKGDTRATAQVFALSTGVTPERGETPNRQALDREDMKILERFAEGMRQEPPSNGVEDE